MPLDPDVDFDVGRTVPFHVARDEVSLPVLRRWCDALGVEDPVHLDPVVAQRSRFGRVVAPLAMLDVWTNPGLAYERDVSDPRGAAYERLDGAGFTSAMAVSSALSQRRPLVLGDRVQSTLTLESVSPEKSTAVGRAHFVVTRIEFTVDDAPVGHARFTVMKFEPSGDERVRGEQPASDPDPPEPPSSDPIAERDALGTAVAAALAEGQRMPPVEIPVTTTLVVAGALATSDFFVGHHDRAAAIERGSPDVFMNIHTTLGLVERCVGRWLGPNTEWSAMSARLGVPNHPGDTMTVTAQVAAVDPASGATSIDYRAVNGLGVHASGAIEVVLPTAAGLSPRRTASDRGRRAGP